MALSASNQVLASEFNSLKARVKNEMNRRCYQDSLAGYAATTYDYAVTPTTGGQILEEHISKIITPINAITSTGYDATKGAPIKALDAVDTQLKAHEIYPIKGSGTDCAGGCSGLCSSGCWDSCTGCTSSCTSSCTGCSGCSGCGSCGGACSSSCSGCSGSCSGTCTGGCSGCTGCSNCSGTCSGSCSGGCKGCGAACSGGGVSSAYS